MATPVRCKNHGRSASRTRIIGLPGTALSSFAPLCGLCLRTVFDFNRQGPSEHHLSSEQNILSIKLDFRILQFQPL
jgi:hypothetical protein